MRTDPHRSMLTGHLARINRFTAASMAVCTLAVLSPALAPRAEAGQAAQAAPQTAQAPTPEGYVPRGTRPGRSTAPGMKVTDLGRGGRTYRVNMVKGDDVMSGLIAFAEKYHIKNAHFTGLGALSKGLFSWADTERGNQMKKIELNQEAEIVSLVGSISTDAQGRTTVHAHGSVAYSDGTIHGGHWFEAYVGIVAEVFVTEEEDAPAEGR